MLSVGNFFGHLSFSRYAILSDLEVTFHNSALAGSKHFLKYTNSGIFKKLQLISARSVRFAYREKLDY